jgi:hypothetical protein
MLLRASAFSLTATAWSNSRLARTQTNPDKARL